MSPSARHGRAFTAFLLTAGLLAGAWFVEPFAEEVAPSPVAPAVLAAQARAVDTSSRTQRQMLTAEDERLHTLLAGLRIDSAPYLQTVDGAETLVLTPRGLGYELADLVAGGAATEVGDGTVLLDTHVLVAPGAHLSLDAPGSKLLMRSDDTGFTSLVAWKGDLTLTGAPGRPLTITSWDPRAGAPDAVPGNGRAYVRTVSGSMDLRAVDAARLGFWAGRTGGVAWTGGSSGPSEGSVADSSFVGSHYGLFASETEGLTVSASRFEGNAIDGLALHRRTVGTAITGSTTALNGRHGVSADQGSEDVALTDLTARANAEYGVYFRGTPLSDGPSAGGASLRAYGTLAVTGGELTGNGKAGVRVVDADDVSIVGTTLHGNRDGVVLVGTAAPTTVAGLTVTGPHRFGVDATSGAAAITGNRVVGADTPIRVRDASAAVTRNTVEQATNHGISVVGTSVGTALVDNTVAGRGPSGLDLHRLADGVSVRSSGNDVDGWVRDRDNMEYWASFVPNHPMLVLWVVILGVPLGLGLRARRRPQPVGVSPYRDDIRRERPAPLRVDLGRPATTGGTA